MNPPAPDPVPPSRQDFVFWPGETSPIGEETTDALRETVARLTGELPEQPEEESALPPSLPPPAVNWQRSTSFGWRDEPRWWEIDFVKEEEGKSPATPKSAPPDSLPLAPKLAPTSAQPPSAPAVIPARPPLPEDDNFVRTPAGAEAAPPAAKLPPPQISERAAAVQPPIPTLLPPPLAKPSPPSSDPTSELARAAAHLLEPSGPPEPPALRQLKSPPETSFLPPPRKKPEASSPVEAIQVESTSAPTSPGFAEALLLSARPEPSAPKEPREKDEPPIAPTVPVLSRRPGLPNARRVGGQLPAEEQIVPHRPTKLEEADEPQKLPRSGKSGWRWFWWLLLLAVALGAAGLWINRERLPPPWKEWLQIPVSFWNQLSTPDAVAMTGAPPNGPDSAEGGAAAHRLHPPSEALQVDSAHPMESAVSSSARGDPSADSIIGSPEKKAASTSTPSIVNDAASPLQSAASTGLSEKASAALVVLQEFVNAAQVEDILPRVQDATNLAPLIKGYYDTQPLRPLENAQIEFVHEGVTTDGIPIVWFHVRHSGCAAGFPVSVEEMREG